MHLTPERSRTPAAQALQHASGAHRRRLEAWRGEMLACLAHTEAVIDFGEDEGLADGVLDNVRPRVAGLLADLERHLRAGRRPALGFRANSGG